MAVEKPYSVVDVQANAEALADEQFLEAFAACADMLGACFLYHPVKEAAADAFGMLRGIDIAIDWPFGEESDRVRAAALLGAGADEFPDAVAQEFTRMVRGTGFSPAPAWGSVYMDREKVMYGRTWLMLRDWMRAHGVVGQYAENDPEDQFGRLLMLAAEVARNRPDLLSELLGDHLLCWSGRFLELFEAGAQTSTYRGVAVLCRTTLDDVRALLTIEPAVRRIYK